MVRDITATLIVRSPITSLMPTATVVALTTVVAPTITVVHAITRDRTDIGQSSNRLTNDVSANKAPGNVPGIPLTSVRLWPLANDAVDGASSEASKCVGSPFASINLCTTQINLPAPSPSKRHAARFDSSRDRRAKGPTRLITLWHPRDKRVIALPIVFVGVTDQVGARICRLRATAPIFIPPYCQRVEPRVTQRVSTKRRSKSQISGKPTRSCSSLIAMLEIGAPWVVPYVRMCSYAILSAAQAAVIPAVG